MRSAPRFIYVSVAEEATLVCRILEGSIETLAAARGLPQATSDKFAVTVRQGGGLSVELGSQTILTCDIGGSYREEVMLWLAVLAGQVAFGSLLIEDGEATLRENLGDAIVRERHLGKAVGVLRASPRQPLCHTMPKGDTGLVFIQMPAMPPVPPEPPPQEPIALLAPEAADLPLALPDPVEVFDACAGRPEVLVGWRIRVGQGAASEEGLVLGMRRRLGRSTQHMVLWTEKELSQNVVLKRKSTQRPGRYCLPFELVAKEF
jgi:hypothetical protein